MVAAATASIITNNMEQDQSQQLNTKSEYELKRQKKLDEQMRLQRKKTTKRISKIILAVLIAGGGIGAFGWYIAKQPSIPESDIISRRGIHWHPELSIYTKGQKQEIPANLGIGANHQPIHTHDTTGVLHVEIQGLVIKGDTKLGRFFKIWGKEFNSNCILNFCNGPDGNVKMLVNSNENFDFENYPMQDKDKIEIRYE